MKTRYVYLAYPIDQRGSFMGEFDTVVNKTRWHLTQAGFNVYEPGRAWTCGGEAPDARLQTINDQVLRQCDAMVAVLPERTPTLGVPVEMERFQGPIVCITDIQSYSLAAMVGVALYGPGELEEAVSWLGSCAGAFRKPQAVARVAGTGETPRRAYEGDAGFDLTYSGTEPIKIQPGESVDVPASVAVQWPGNTWCLLIGRSSTFRSRGLLVNPAIIDSGYRGELFAICRNIGLQTAFIMPGDRIAQVVPFPNHAEQMIMERVEQLDPSERGSRGFGSSGS